MSLRRLGVLALIVLVFVAIGPLIGLLVTAMLSFVGVSVSQGISGAWSVPAFLLLYGWLLAHLMGAVPALVAGVIVAGYAGWRGRVPLIVGALAGLAAAVFLNVVSRYGMGIGSQPQSTGTAFILIWIAAHVVSSIACTRLTRRWQQQV